MLTQYSCGDPLQWDHWEGGCSHSIVLVTHFSEIIDKVDAQYLLYGDVFQTLSNIGQFSFHIDLTLWTFDKLLCHFHIFPCVCIMVYYFKYYQKNLVTINYYYYFAHLHGILSRRKRSPAVAHKERMAQPSSEDLVIINHVGYYEANEKLGLAVDSSPVNCTRTLLLHPFSHVFIFGNMFPESRGFVAMPVTNCIKETFSNLSLYI